MNVVIYFCLVVECVLFYYVVMFNEEIDYLILLGVVMVDIVIIGGGFIGVVMVVELVECGYKVVLVEIYCIGWGVSGCNGGQVIGSLFGDVVMYKQMC